MPVKVILWTHPRSVSTAFECCIGEVKHSKVFHELYGGPYYFGPERQSPRYTHLPIDPNVSYDSITKLLTKEYNADVVFAKEMAYCMEGHIGYVSKELAAFQHTFLIRDPRQSIPSLYKGSINKGLTGWENFLPAKAGFKQMVEMYDYLKSRVKKKLVVVDAHDLLVDPEGTMKAYTRETGIPYNADMLTWKPGKVGQVEGWNKVWGGWFEDVMKSSGFIKRTKEKVHKYEDVTLLPPIVQTTIAENVPHYLYLKKEKVNPCS